MLALLLDREAAGRDQKCRFLVVGMFPRKEGRENSWVQIGISVCILLLLSVAGAEGLGLVVVIGFEPGPLERSKVNRSPVASDSGAASRWQDPRG